jgi:hypothetical protein
MVRWSRALAARCDLSAHLASCPRAGVVVVNLVVLLYQAVFDFSCGQPTPIGMLCSAGWSLQSIGLPQTLLVSTRAHICDVGRGRSSVVRRHPRHLLSPWDRCKLNILLKLWNFSFQTMEILNLTQ